MGEPTIFEIGRSGRRGYRPPSMDPHALHRVPVALRRKRPPVLPEVSDVELMRYYVRLSTLNFSVDGGFYPLGSCTMKYNPKIHERIARLGGFVEPHPFWDEGDVQPLLGLLWEMEELLKTITGMAVFTLQAAAGAHGELTGMLIARAFHRSRGEDRKVVLIPDSAHGTNPASAVLAGFNAVQVQSDRRGMIDLTDLRAKMGPEVAALMLTNPNTLGIFEADILKIARLAHASGAVVYYDGANLNALLGRCRPGDMGLDIVHLNLHKTFSTPHGGGGPGAGPVGVTTVLEPFLPLPRIVRAEDRFCLDWDRPSSIGKMATFYGHIGVILRAYVYIRMLGGEGLRRTAEMAVLNANYLRRKLAGLFELPFATPSMHEFVVSALRQKKAGGSALDIAKRLLDYGFHPPTVYFPLIVREALMVEPTETESPEMLDRFAEALKQIVCEIEETPEVVHEAPHTTPVRRLDEARAALRPVLRWRRVLGS